MEQEQQQEAEEKRTPREKRPLGVRIRETRALLLRMAAETSEDPDLARVEDSILTAVTSLLEASDTLRDRE